MIRTVWIVIILLWVSVSAFAHEVRPAFLKITEAAHQEFNVAWRQPITDGKRLRMAPAFPEGCTVQTGETTLRSAKLTEQMTLSCDLTTGRITIEGLERTLTDVFVEISFLSGETRRDLLKPDKPFLDLAGPPSAPTTQYLRIGVDHILFGWDHLLFVIGLVLLVSRRQIIGVATSFTIAHSLTLALAAFGLLNIPTRPVEILIAMSIVLLAIEIMRKRKGHKSLATERPYLIGFLIGLIHGCGFASALSEIGLPKGTELLALLLFNVGVEMGQFLIIGAFVFLLALLSKMSFNRCKIIELGITYAIGTIAMFWVIDRIKDYVI